MKTCTAVAGLCLIAAGAGAEPALTIYNQNFAVVRDSVPLDLKKGINEVRFAETTAHLEPDSVILRDPAGKVKLQILEQNYRNDPVSQELLLSLFEGKTIDFFVRETNKPDRTVQGKIIRSGYVAHSQEAMQRYGQRYYQSQMAMAYGGGGSNQPIVEVDGQIRFGLPGVPIFPSLGDDTILKPMLSWTLEAGKSGKLTAELAYVTGGMSWEADYNVVAPETGDLLAVTGWVTMDNQSGKTFENAQIKLMAGDVSKMQARDGDEPGLRISGLYAMRGRSSDAPPVSEKAFDEYHLYTLQRPSTLRDRETKQVEFIRATGVKSQKVYVYDGIKVDWNRWRGYNLENLRQNSEFGTESNTKVAVMREFKNSEDNQLGMPLPKGRVRFYKQDGAQLEFTGENVIDHTPKDEMVKVYTGNAFDLVGERRRTLFTVDSSNRWADEAFEIKLRNHKQEAVEIRVVEHLYRWLNWSITEKTQEFTKANGQEIKFLVSLKPDEEKTITYKVHYSW
ncbi:MAG: hypothetical protein WC708_05905 [Lentisphaeria bacterium]